MALRLCVLVVVQVDGVAEHHHGSFATSASTPTASTGCAAAAASRSVGTLISGSKVLGGESGVIVTTRDDREYEGAGHEKAIGANHALDPILPSLDETLIGATVAVHQVA